MLNVTSNDLAKTLELQNHIPLHASHIDDMISLLIIQKLKHNTFFRYAIILVLNLSANLIQP